MFLRLAILAALIAAPVTSQVTAQWRDFRLNVNWADVVWLGQTPAIVVFKQNNAAFSAHSPWAHWVWDPTLGMWTDVHIQGVMVIDNRPCAIGQDVYLNQCDVGGRNIGQISGPVTMFWPESPFVTWPANCYSADEWVSFCRGYESPQNCPHPCFPQYTTAYEGPEFYAIVFTLVDNPFPRE